MSPRNVTVTQERDTSTEPLPPTGSPGDPAQPPPMGPDGAAHAPPAVDGGAPAPASDAPDVPEQGLKALGREALHTSEHTAPEVAEVPAPAPRPGTAAEAGEGEDGSRFDLGRVAWMVTVLSSLLAVAILAVDGYVGYACVTLAVALAAAINLV